MGDRVILVKSPAHVIHVQQQQPVVRVLRPGEQGPPGPPGPPGSDNFHVQHDQPAAAATWTINHNLGKRPNVSVYSAGGLEVWAEVLHVSVNQALISFDAPFAGFAILS
jgi:hypothetical protein